ncbi:hypothetical protein JA1_001455 [Spathaspora sp. JA1]|nr:hypothetical protein JA1_001455 [Spathaspora sp. JA1]
MPTSSLYTKFPFNCCSDDHLRDSPTLIYHGIDLTIQFGMIDVQEIQEFERVRLINEEDEEEEDDDMQDICGDTLGVEDMEIVPPSPILPPSRPRRPSLKKNHKSSDVSFSMSRDKICSIINEHFSQVRHEDSFTQIRNYVVNCILESFGDLDIDKICQRLINKSYRGQLTGKVKTMFIEKYEEMKLDSLMDYFCNLFNVSQGISINQTNNPQFYEKYYRIWKLQLNDYQYYDQEYFFDCYINATTIQNLFLQNGFLLNYTRFKHYFTRDIMNHPYDGEEEEEEEPEDIVIDSDYSTSKGRVRQVYEYTPAQFVDIPKRLRFDDDIKIKLDGRLPVDHVM